MKKLFLLSAAALFVTGSAAFAQSNSMSSSGSADPMSAAKPDQAMHQNEPGTDAHAAMTAKHTPRKTARNEAKLNANEAQTTKELNEQQSQYASNDTGASMSSSSSSSSDMASNSGSSGMRGSNAAAPSNGMGKVTGANSGVEGRIGGSNSNMPQ